MIFPTLKPCTALFAACHTRSDVRDLSIRNDELVAAYQKSDLRQSNDRQLAEYATQRSSLNDASLKELSVKRATVTPFWFAIKTLFMVRMLPYALATISLSSLSWRSKLIFCQYTMLSLN